MVNWGVSRSNSGDFHQYSPHVPQINMANRPNIRKSAYHYICDRLSRIPPGLASSKENLIIPLDDLRLLREGLADPSPEMVALIKQILCPAISESEIADYLVNPFRKKLES